MTVRRHQHPHISVPQLRSPFHRTSNRTISVRGVDVVVFDRQDHSTNSTKILAKKLTIILKRIRSKKDVFSLYDL